MKVDGIPQRFSWSQSFSFNKILSCFIAFMTEIFCFVKISQFLLSSKTTTLWPLIHHRLVRVVNDVAFILVIAAMDVVVAVGAAHVEAVDDFVIVVIPVALIDC
jgi:hypothetical protein